MNETQVTFTGWVGSDVSLTETPGGQTVATFRVGSTPRRLVAGSWQDAPTNWFTVKAWRSLASNAQLSVRSGDAVVVTGRLTTDVWERSDGQKSTRYLVVATSIGHDLNKGTATFVKSPRAHNVPADDTAVQQVVHSYDEGGPNLDANGEVVTPSVAGPRPADESVGGDSAMSAA
ncbi:MAG: single-stranded DNA-binding protein [Nocardioides sp.]